jgi:cation:H+ antiporter
LIIVGLVGVVLGSNMVVDAAKIIAQVMGVSERVISLTIIAFGTSLPELVTTIVAAKKGEQDLLVGNIIGSNIFNIAVVLGVPSIIFGGVDVASVSRIDMIAFVVAAAVLMGFALHRKELDRKEGLLMLLIFATYYGYVALA